MTGTRLRVLHVIHGAPGGIGRVEKLLSAVWARKQGFEVTTIQRMAYPSYLDPSAPEGAVKKMGRGPWLLAIVATFLANRPHVVILNHINFAPLVIAFRIVRPSARLVVLAYGRELQMAPSRLQRWGIRLASQVWSISEYSANELSAVCGLDRTRITVVPLALLPHRAVELGRGPAPAANGRCEILTVSRLWVRHGEGKGVDHLIEALAATDPCTHLVVVGDGDDRPRLERLASELGVGSRVRFTGHIDDQTLVDLYRRCHLFVLPSLREGFGLVFLEAMAAGKAVVAARAGAVPELVRDRETGVLVPYGDPTALSRAIQWLVTDPAQAKEFGRRGRQRAEDEFGFARFEAQVCGLLLGSG